MLRKSVQVRPPIDCVRHPSAAGAAVDHPNISMVALAIGFALWFRSGQTSWTTRDHGRTLMLEHAKYWHSRAEEARVLAELLEDVQSKQIMLGIAGDYRRMAELAEQRVKSGGLPSAPWRGRRLI